MWRCGASCAGGSESKLAFLCFPERRWFLFVDKNFNRSLVVQLAHKGFPKALFRQENYCRQDAEAAQESNSGMCSTPIALAIPRN
jgi:hypothetical protein